MADKIYKCSNCKKETATHSLELAFLGREVVAKLCTDCLIQALLQAHHPLIRLEVIKGGTTS